MVRGALKLFYNDHFQVPLPPNHRFPMSKYALVRKALQRELTPRGLASFHPSPLATLNELTACHTAEYVDRYVNNKLSERVNPAGIESEAAANGRLRLRGCRRSASTSRRSFQM